MQERELTGSSAAPVPTDGAAPTTRAADFALLIIELMLIVTMVRLFGIENQRHLFPVLWVIVGGFVVHAWLPARFRIQFFAVLSIGGILFVLGMDNGLRVISVGGVLIGITYLPVGFRSTVVTLATAVAVLVVLRVQFPNPFWPVLGSMFMFRLIIYVYDNRQSTVRPPVAESIAYFFMLPNVCFPLFPVVDYRTFKASWFNEIDFQIYQRGVVWMVRGIVHLLLYRYIKTYLVPEPYEMHDVPHVALFMATNYALYLQVSGQFHLIAGILHLFGFNLPRTHNLFFLASSFSDIWRRINIYWKDFMTKLFFYPAFFATRRRGANLGPSIVAGVFCVFVATWLLHSWQTFWLLGRFPVTANDAFLWLGVGACVAVNALLDSTQRKRTAPKWLAALGLSSRIVGMFTLVSLFWACWTKPGFLYSIKGVLQRPEAVQGLLTMGVWISSAVAVGTVLAWFHDRRQPDLNSAATPEFRESAKRQIALLGLSVVIVSPWLSHVFPENISQAMAAFRTNAVETQSAGERLQSYYEDLNLTAIQAGPFVSSFAPDAESLRAQAMGFNKVARPADMYQEIELIPGLRTETNGNPFNVNQFGMRDRRSVSLHRPPNTKRIAFVGSSIVMGYGVSDEDVFARVFESGLNAQRRAGSHRFEVLNFGVGKQWATHRLVRIQRKVVGFEPNAVYYFAHQDEFENLVKHTAKLVAHDLELPSQHLRDVANNARVNSDLAWGAVQSKLRRFESEILSAVYKTIVDECRDRQMVPVWLYVPIPESDGEDPGSRLMAIAAEAGFIVCDLTGWADDRNADDLFSSLDEHHPNAMGHRLIANALLELAAARPDVLPAK
jgi:hypothetical protein